MLHTKNRLPLIDALRGVTILEMAAFHFLWDMVYLFHLKLDWYRGMPGFLWQQSICWTFILLSGFCWKLGHHPLRRGLWAFGGGLLVTLVTMVILPGNSIFYGILTFIGSCVLLWIPLDPLLEKLPPEPGLALSALLFGVTRAWTWYSRPLLPEGLRHLPLLNELAAYLGFPQPGFHSTDYFPILPWIFLFAAGYFLFGVLKKYGLLQRLLGRGRVPLLNTLGRHSLLVYLVHQPLCYLLALGLSLVLT